MPLISLISPLILILLISSDAGNSRELTEVLGLFHLFRCRSSHLGIETLGEAWNFSWEIHIRCLDDGREGLKHKCRCDYRKYLDLETLVCTRGRDFPIARVAERLRCPRCGCREVSVMFSPPKTPQRAASAALNPRDAMYADDSDD